MTDHDIILERARRHASGYARSKGRSDEAERVEQGKADDTPIMQVLVWLFTDADGTPANTIVTSELRF